MVTTKEIYLNCFALLKLLCLTRKAVCFKENSSFLSTISDLIENPNKGILKTYQ